LAANNHFFVAKNGLAVGNTTSTKHVINSAGQWIGDPTGIIQDSYDHANAAYNKANTSIVLNGNSINLGDTVTLSSLANGSYTLTLRSDGNLVLPTTTVEGVPGGSIDVNGALVLNANGNQWLFDTLGNLKSPYGIEITTQGIGWNDGSTQNTAAAPLAYSEASYNKANIAFDQVNLVYNFANSINTVSQFAYEQANTGTIIAQSAYDFANTISSQSIDQFVLYHFPTGDYGFVTESIYGGLGGELIGITYDLRTEPIGTNGLISLDLGTL
jgi:hypothetical protein